MKHINRSIIFAFILGFAIACTSTVLASYVIYSNQIDYKPTDESWNVNNVEGALNDLYNHIDSMPNRTIQGIYEKNIRGGYGENININYTVPDNVNKISLGIVRTFAFCTFQTINISGSGLVSIQQTHRNSQGNTAPYVYMEIYELSVIPGGVINIKTNETNLSYTSGNYSSYVYVSY